MYVTETVVSHNQATSSGGGIHTDKRLTLHDVQIISNSVTSGNGGGVALGNNSAIVTQTGVLTLAYNQVDARGGGVYVGDGLLSMDGARILSNNAGDQGGAIYQNDLTNGITVTNSCLVFNSDTAVFHSGGPALSATSNWWGASDGPSGAASGHGDSINNASNIDASGFLTTAPVGCPGYTPTLSLVGGSGQSAEVTQPFGLALTVTLAMDNGGPPFAGEVITFTGPDSGASISPTIVTATTDSSGVATAAVTANDIKGSYGVTATTSVGSNSVTFSLTNTGGIEIYLPIVVKNQ
ncbi:MAG: hypothetical protein Kow0031_15530 [Anaerolineae bacterium]